jgi:colanic acid/amylovoran biosynthesis protein
MRLLLIGNHTCANRGDCAILRGLIQEIERQRPDATLTVASRSPDVAAYMLGRPVENDPFALWHRTKSNGFPGKAKIASRALPLLMWLALRTGWRWPVALLPETFRGELAALMKFDAVIQVGGSFFVDLYGAGQYEYPFAALLARRPVFLAGHSLGPFNGSSSRRLARMLLDRSREVALREPVSRDLIERDRLPLGRVTAGADTAWAVPPSVRTRAPLAWLGRRSVARPLIAITMRELAPFDRRLGTTQQIYEAAFAKLVCALLDAGYDVVAASTCTGIGSYARDDRMNALRVAEIVRQPQRFHVVMDELDDVALGELFSACHLLIGTRLHSAIIAMNFGTPALALNYEHKSEGVMRQLGLPELSHPVQSLLDGSLMAQVLTVLGSLDSWREKVAAAVARERERTRAMVSACLQSLTSGGRA